MYPLQIHSLCRSWERIWLIRPTYIEEAILWYEIMEFKYVLFFLTLFGFVIKIDRDPEFLDQTVWGYEVLWKWYCQIIEMKFLKTYVINKDQKLLRAIQYDFLVIPNYMRAWSSNLFWYNVIVKLEERNKIIIFVKVTRPEVLVLLHQWNYKFLFSHFPYQCSLPF